MKLFKTISPLKSSGLRFSFSQKARKGFSRASSVLPVIPALIPIGPEHEPGDPRRCPRHLLTDALDAGVFFRLNDQFIM